MKKSNLEKLFETFKNQFGYSIDKNNIKYATRYNCIMVNNDNTFKPITGLKFNLWNDTNDYIYYPDDNKIYVNENND